MKQKIVNSYLSILRSLAQAHLTKNKPLTIGITGSAGKSSCTKLLANVLDEEFKVKYTKKGNSETGIPFEILNIPVSNYSSLAWLFLLFKGLNTVLFNWEEYSILIAEMGIDSNRAPKDMSTLLKIVQPEIGVLLNVNNVHIEYFHGEKVPQTIANEKAKLLFKLPANGLAIINADQKEITSLTDQIKASIKTFSQKKKADLQLIKHNVSLSGSEFTFLFENKEYSVNIDNQLVFEEAFGTIAATFLIAHFLKIKPKNIIKYIEKNYTTLPGRGMIFEGLNQSIIIDSSYNSSLGPTSASLKLLNKLKKKNNRTIAVLGDMRELGEAAQKDHQALQKVALENADIIYTVGPLTTEYFTNKKVRKVTNPFELVPLLSKELKKGDIILFKGSQNTILLESVVAELLKNKVDTAKLCRRSSYWDQQRKKLKEKLG